MTKTLFLLIGDLMKKRIGHTSHYWDRLLSHYRDKLPDQLHETVAALPDRLGTAGLHRI